MELKNIVMALCVISLCGSTIFFQQLLDVSLQFYQEILRTASLCTPSPYILEKPLFNEAAVNVMLFYSIYHDTDSIFSTSVYSEIGDMKRSYYFA